MLTAHLIHAAASFLAAPPSSAPADPPTSAGNVNTHGVVTFLTTQIVPILLAVLGVIFISRARQGQVSQVVTSSGIAMVGLAFIAGAGSLFFFGGHLVDVFLTK